MRNNFSKFVLTVGFGLTIALSSAYAQGLYLDVGGGIGSGTTKLSGLLGSKGELDVSDNASFDLALEAFSLKVGYGPFPIDIPIYVVGVIGGFAHQLKYSYGTAQYNSYLIGPGVVVYPIDMLQLGLSAGISWIANETISNSSITVNETGSGFAWEVSAAANLGSVKHACLLGIKYFSANNEWKSSKVEQKSSMIGIFVKYAFRTKGGGE